MDINHGWLAGMIFLVGTLICWHHVLDIHEYLSYIFSFTNFDEAERLETGL